MVVPLGSIFSTEVLGAGAAGLRRVHHRARFRCRGRRVVAVGHATPAAEGRACSSCSIFVASGALFIGGVDARRLAFAAHPRVRARCVRRGRCTWSASRCCTRTSTTSCADASSARCTRSCGCACSSRSRSGRSCPSCSTASPARCSPAAPSRFPGGQELFLPGVRLTLWFASVIIFVAGLIVAAVDGVGTEGGRRC